MFVSPLGLLALFGVPAVVGLYLFRRRIRPRRVSAIFLWDAPQSNATAGRRIERLRTDASFWCELLAALLLGLLAAGPRGCGSARATHLVCVLDGSASMCATDDDGSAAERAREWIDEELASLSGRSRATILVSGPRPKILAGPAAPLSEARLLLKEYTPEHAGHDIGATLDLARELARDGRILMASDHMQEGWVDERTHFRSFGRPLANVGIVHAVRERDEGQEIAWVTVFNASAEPATRFLLPQPGSDPATKQTLELEPMERRTLRLPLERPREMAFIALEGDALAIDDSVKLEPVPARTLILHVALPAPMAGALGLDATGERWANLLGEATVALRPEDAHLVLGPSTAPNAWTFEFLEGADTAWLGPFLFDRGHSLTEGVGLEGTVWMGRADAQLTGTPIVSSGDRTLLAEIVTPRRRSIVANLDPTATNLSRMPDWPIMLSNWSEARRAELPGPSMTNLAQGETLRWRGLKRGTHILVQPDGERREVDVDGRLVLDRLHQIGGYTLLDPDESEVGRFAVHFEDSDESNLRTRLAGEIETSRARAEIVSRHDPLPSLMWATVLGLALFDAFLLWPRRRGGLA